MRSSAFDAVNPARCSIACVMSKTPMLTAMLTTALIAPSMTMCDSIKGAHACIHARKLTAFVSALSYRSIVGAM